MLDKNHKNKNIKIIRKVANPVKVLKLIKVL